MRGWLVRDGKPVNSSSDDAVVPPVILGAEKVSAVVSTLPVLVMETWFWVVRDGVSVVLWVVAAARDVWAVVSAFPPLVLSCARPVAEKRERTAKVDRRSVRLNEVREDAMFVRSSKPIISGDGRLRLNARKLQNQNDVAYGRVSLTGDQARSVGQGVLGVWLCWLLGD